MGLLIVFSLNPVFWTNLIAPRFFIVYMPFLFSLIFKNLSKGNLKLIALILFISGVFFSGSSFLNQSFLPKKHYPYKNLVYENVGLYSTQYLKYDILKESQPQFLSLSYFDFACRICKLGTDKINYESLHSFEYVTYNYLPIDMFLKGYTIKNAQPLGLTKFDMACLKHLTPIENRYPMIYTLVKSAKINK